MDPITHTLTGAAIGRAGLAGRTALLWPAVLIGANLPDVDVLALFWGDPEALAFRRGWTHGVLAMAVLPAVLAGCLLLWDRRPRARRPDRAPVRPRWLLLASALAVWSHPLLDWLNIYGIRLLMPASDRWFYGDALFIVDPWVWGALALGILLARRGRTAAARLALGAFALYAAGMWIGSSAARAAAAADLARTRAAAESDRPPAERRAAGISPSAVVAAPVPLDPFERRLIADEGTRWRSGRIGLGGPPRWEPPEAAIPKRPELAAAVAGDPAARRFLVWARLPYFERIGSGIRVGDARYRWASVLVPAPAASRHDPRSEPGATVSGPSESGRSESTPPAPGSPPETP